MHATSRTPAPPVRTSVPSMSKSRTRVTVWRSTLRLLRGDRDRGAQPCDGIVEVVSHLQRELVLARGQLHVDLGFAVAEVNPRRCALDDGLAGREAALVNSHMV